MNNNTINQNDAKAIENMNRVFDLQKKNSVPSNQPNYNTRIDRLNRLENMVRENIDAIYVSLNSDFGTRAPEWSFTGDIYPVLHHIQVVRKNLKTWMKKERKSNGLMALSGEKTYVINEPLGVVGVMSPFNAPVSLGLDPAVDAIAGGNSVMIKISESTPKTAELIKRIVKGAFKESEIAVITGEAEVSKQFASLAWDKFVFTGGSEVGKKILSAAAPNLTPVLLELGGKSPCVVLEDADIEETAKKIGLVRLLNGGQVCISGDYAIVPEKNLEAFLTSMVDSVSKHHTSIIDNEHFTSLINDNAYNRITSYIDEAIAAGSRIIQVNPKNEPVPDPVSRKVPLTIVVNPSDDLMVSKYEIFGPILSVFTYNKREDIINQINKREKALALYIFGKNKSDIDYIIQNTSSGGVTVNDLLMHANAAKSGFGGVGYSGMGRYKGGFIGFQAFTNPKTIVEQGLMGRFSTAFFPPYRSERIRKILQSQVGIK